MGFRRQVPIGVTALLLTGTLYLPFLAKPFHIDDPNFVTMARALELPWGVRPGVVLHHLGEISPSLDPLASTHPPLVPYLLRLAAALAGGYREPALHAAFLLFPLLLLWAVGDLARRLEISPAPVMLAVGGSVAVLPVGHNLMADLPTAALFAGAAAALARAGERRSPAWTMLAAGLALLALAASYQVAFLLPALVLLLPRELITARTTRWAVGVSVLLLLATGVVLGPFLLARLPGFTQGLRFDWLVNRLTTTPALLGTALIFLLPTAAWRRMPRWGLAATGATGLATGLPLAADEGMTLGSASLVLVSLVGASAIGLLVLGIYGSRNTNRIERFLAAWAGSALLVALLLLPFGAFRYLIPIVIPTTLLMLARMRGQREAWLRSAATATLGVVVAIGDFQFAATYRDFAVAVRREVGDGAGRVWFAGDWGMKPYMAAEGFLYLTSRTNEPAPGDLVVLAETARMWSPSLELGARLDLLDVREIRPRWPLLLMSKSERAGYYSTLWGPFPFVYSHAPIERFGVFRVSRR